ncbi:hypothetical protein M758_7G057900 [Ceratodon purpureus]|nr:hypothetical protein M758_7G057900 [Ceratodon purpureus]KAG0610340.1 hypothetical protein M758_7G057900 [Ceratodon purpureus]KAG0610341.1 hypothetical protein M758_7G057900 [Ceratodon purpureus]
MTVMNPRQIDTHDKKLSVYSPVQVYRIDRTPPLPKVFNGHFRLENGPPTTSAGHPEDIKKLFPHTFGQPSVHLAPCEGACFDEARKLKVGVVLSGGQAPGGHNVIAGMFDYLEKNAPGSVLFGFKGGPAGIMRNKWVEITSRLLYPFRNQGGFDIIGSGRDKIETPEQFQQAVDTVVAMDLDGLVVIGGDDSNTNAAMLAEHFREKKIKTAVLGCPKTIDGDLKSKQVPISFGFDTACKIYSEMIGNIMVDARSTQKYYHFIRLMGRAASHITLECAFQTHPNGAIIGEEIHHQKKTLRQVTNTIADIICKRAHIGKHYGVFLIPEGLIDFIPEIQTLIAELNDLLATQACDADAHGAWRTKLKPQARALFASLPSSIQDQLLLERDPHGNVQVAKIETEKMLISMVEEELSHRRHEDTFPGQFKGQAHFFGYEGRCGMPTNFDATYCYALGFAASALLGFGHTGLIASVSNLTDKPAEWVVGGTALTELMDLERRAGRDKPVIRKAMVELDGGPFREFARVRDAWAVEDSFVSPGPIQFAGPSADDTCFTLKLELGACVSA